MMAAQALNFGGGMNAAPLAVVLENERKTAQETQAQLLVTSLAAHIRQAWWYARDAKMMNVEARMLQSIRARRGEYDPERLAAIRAQGGSDVYAMLTSVKCRAAGSWIRDVIAGQGEDRPWALKPTPQPELPPDIHDEIVEAALEPIMQAENDGVPLTDVQIQALLETLKDSAQNKIKEEAQKAADRMADKMDEQLTLGRFRQALSEFIDDVVTFPTAILKGPVIRRKKRLTWGQVRNAQMTSTSFTPVIAESLVMEWERVSPFRIYPSPSATTVDDGYLLERHSLSREDLNQLIGVDGYDAASIRMVLDEFRLRGHVEWWANVSAENSAEGKPLSALATNPEGLIDALQYWGSVPGQTLLDWGMKEADIKEPTKEYHIEAWLVGHYVIKAVLNTDPLNRKPYYKASYENIPGSWWGNSVADLVRDSQVVVNAAARAMVNNMAMSSGPQVAVNIDRLPKGEPINTLTPWRVWQLRDDPAGAGGGGLPIQFFQPEAFVAELMQVFEKFDELADEYSGIPRYMTGDATGGAGRTASGLSMLVSNAGKSIKQVISNIDLSVMKPLLERLYMYNMLYSSDPDLKGDINIIASGAAALLSEENAQVRRNEFLAATANPIDMQIVGLKGRAAVLRKVVKTLDMDPDEVVPPAEVLQLQQATQAAEMARAQAAQAGAPGGPAGAPPAPTGGPAGAMAPGNIAHAGGGAALPIVPQDGVSRAAPEMNKQRLSTGAPVTDNFAPMRT